MGVRREFRMGFTPIEGYGVIGNLETCPLVSEEGSIDWCCFPHIESSSVFAALLDDDGGGHFSIQPAEEYTSEQSYITRTNVLRTTFETDSGTMVVTDFMPVVDGMELGHTVSAIYRKVTCVEGSVEFELEFDPRFDYDRVGTTVETTSEGVLGRGNGEQCYLWGEAPFETTEGTIEYATATETLDTDETDWFVLQYNDREPIDAADCAGLLRETIDFWQDWTHQCPDESGCAFEGPYHDYVVRSELVLRLLMNPQTHAIAAAPTTSLPEEIGGIRNWDYRYAWIRDVSYTIQALHELGHEREARNGFDWCLTMCHKDDPGEIGHPLYGLHYEPEMVEEELDHLSGYRGSQPVRVGNAAGDQEQLDTYGELMTAIYTASDYGADIYEGDWEVLKEMIEYVSGVWDRKDNGIWEVRSEPSHIVHSKVLCWAALDRGIEIAEEHGFDAPLERWRGDRETIREVVLEEGYDDELDCFTQTFAGETVDAAALRLGSVGFLPFDDDRFQATIDAVMEHLMTDDGLVHRYEGDDGLPGEEGAFVLCSFWLVECLARSDRVEEAREVFEGVMEYISPLGLFAEEVDSETGEHLGNFPQAFSHIGLVNAVLYLNEATDD